MKKEQRVKRRPNGSGGKGRRKVKERTRYFTLVNDCPFSQYDFVPLPCGNVLVMWRDHEYCKVEVVSVEEARQLYGLKRSQGYQSNR